MRRYSAFEEETLRARRFVEDWASMGLLSGPQKTALEKETSTDLRRTNAPLRAVLFLFTAGSMGALAALYDQIFSPHGTATTLFFSVFAAASLGLAEYAISRARFYRHGIEEALAAMAVLFLCLAAANVLQPKTYSTLSAKVLALVPLIGAAASLLMYRRFGFVYAVLASLIFLAFVPAHLVTDQTLRRGLLAGFYTVGLACMFPTRQNHREDFLEEEYGTIQAMLWLALYLTLNLQLSSSDFFYRSYRPSGTIIPANPLAFYWGTYALIWMLPAAAITRGLRARDRAALDAGILMALLTLVTNKSYLGWPRHPWDPMLLGVLLAGGAVALRRWLAQGPNGVRAGVTSARLSESDKKRLVLLAGISGLAAPGLTPDAGAGPVKPDFGGGRSGGGGASGNW